MKLTVISNIYEPASGVAYQSVSHEFHLDSDPPSVKLATGLLLIHHQRRDSDTAQAGREIHNEQATRMPTAEVADVLLTPSESNVLSSFLSAVDRLDPNTPQFLAPEWNMYAATLSNQVHLQEGKEDLARATKELIGSGFGSGDAASGSFHAAAPHLYNPVQNRGAHGGQAFGSSSRKLSSASGADGTQLPHAFLQNARSWPNVPQSSQNAIMIKDTTFNPYGMVPPQSLSFSGAGGSLPSSRPSLAAISTSLPGSSVSGSLSATPTTARPPLSAASSVSQGASRKRPSLEVRHPASAPAGVSLESNKRSRPSPPGLAGSSGAHRSSSVVSRDSESTSPQVPRSSISRASFSSTVSPIELSFP